MLVCVALLGFATFWVLDYFVTGGGQVVAADGPLERYALFDPGMITDAIPALAGMTAAVLGIVITVVSIVVQLAAERYAGVTTMFFRDRINVGVMAFYVVACVSGIWTSMSVHENFVPEHEKRRG